jgi:heterodisulfide reductase subunit A-like polyferredoxin
MEKVGAVLVVGGGIAGMQASLDLADSGFKVYLSDKSPTIGGVMAQLDKTFPTNDCAMCILSPKLVDAGRHPNIEILTQSRIEKVEGEAGNFKVRVRRKARYVDGDKCTGCGECVNACPQPGIIPNEFDVGLSDRAPIYVPFPQAVPLVYTIDKREGKPPCELKCPASVNVQCYVALVSQGRFKEAVDLIREKNPLPTVCGHICPHPCEDECNRGKYDDPIAIAALKRFAADHVLGEDASTPVEPTKDEKIAIIGSGPAGLTAAYYLAKKGYPVKIFEKLSIPGGMLATGIPAYRLPRKVLQKDIDYIKGTGVEIETNAEVNKDRFEWLRNVYDAIFISVGSHVSRELGIEGEDLEGVIHGVDFLRDLNLGKKVKIGKKVAVIGGGDVAVDAARCARRLGSNVTIIYRRSQEEMPAICQEVRAAEEEGVGIRFLAAPTRILDVNKVENIECIRMKLGPPDETGRRRPIPIEGSEFLVEVDTVIPAIGQSSDLCFLGESGLNTLNGRWIEAHEDGATNEEGVFAGGDCVTGPATVVEAVGAGRRAAEAIDAYLEGKVLPEKEEEKKIGVDEVETPKQKGERTKMPTLSPVQRVKNFDEVELGYDEEMATEEAKRCLHCKLCCECKLCEKACDADAINLEMADAVLELDVGAIILAPGFDEFDPSVKKEYGYGIYPNVVSSIQFERMLSASGPFHGTIIRPSDGKNPKKIAFIQCVGSRDTNTNEYCSSVCCMYAIKEAIIAQEHTADIMPHIFFMDIRAYGKEFDEYYEKAKSEHGIEFTRCRVASIEEIPEKRNLIVRYIEDGELKGKEFDMVVLSVGLQAPSDAKGMAEKLGIELNKYGFCSTNLFSPLESSKPGIYVCGAFSSPKDIPETVAGASGASAKASSIISSERGKLVTKKEYPPERDVSDEETRIGIFICHCGINIGGVVDVPGVTEYAKTLPNVVYAENNLYTCSQDTQERIKEKVCEYNLNRVIVASCTPRTHEPLFQNTCREAGLNQYLFEMANIRDQCSWVHMHKPEEATRKAKDLVRMAVAKSRLLEPLEQRQIDINPKSLVIGGGLAGMTASLELAEQGYEVYLVEKEEEFGGNLRKIHFTLEGDDPQMELKEIIKRVEDNQMVHVFRGAKINAIDGYVGNFVTRIEQNGREEEIKHGVVIVATGAEECKPREYLYGEDDRVLTQLELEERFARGEIDAKSVAMIQCVGSRNEERPYCSRVCCANAVKNALKLKEQDKDMTIYVLYKDMRTYGFKEDYYEEASKRGVIFLRYDDEHKPEVTADGRLSVRVKDPVLDKRIEINPDLLVLSTAITPNEDNEELSKMLKIPLSKDGFFLEAHMKLRPVEFATEGVFLAGLAHWPKTIDESISQACGAVSRACTILSKERLEAAGITSSVDELLCGGCLTCVEVCPYNAIEMKTVNPFGYIKEVASVNAILCKGCGSCASACPSGAVQQSGFKDNQILAMIEKFVEVI